MMLAALALAAAAPVPLDDGWQEAVVSVADLDERVRFFRDVVGWEVVDRRPVSREQLRAWRLPDGATAETVLLGSPGTARGRVRLVAFEGVGQPGRIRSSAQPWESGGWAALNVRVRSLDAAFRSLQRAGWQGFSDPVRLVVPPYTVREAMMVGPDGLTVALIERVEPPVEGRWPGLWSEAVTAVEAAADAPASRRFYGNLLGLKARLAYDGPAAEPGMNLFGLPHDLVAKVTRRVDWWQARGRGDGTIATLSFAGVAGRRFADGAAPPRLGLFLVAMPVSDAAARCARASAGGAPTIRAAAPLDRPPYGRVVSCTIATPDGAWLELFTPARIASP